MCISELKCSIEHTIMVESSRYVKILKIPKENYVQIHFAVLRKRKKINHVTIKLQCGIYHPAVWRH